MNFRISKLAFSLSAISLLLFLLSPQTQANQTTRYTYNVSGLIESIDGPRKDVNDITTFTYDASGNRTLITNALGHVTHITAFDLSGRPLTIVDANGAITTLTYDARGRLLSQDTAGRLTTTFNYDKSGNVTQISQSNGQILTYYYDDAHRPIGYSDHFGNQVSYTLDNAGNRIKEDISDPTNQLTRTHQFIYDELSRLRADMGANAQTTTLEYDTNNNLIAQTDPNGNTTQFAFDGLNRLIGTTDAANGSTIYTYDERDNLISVTDPKGLITTYSYDVFDNVIEQNSPDTGITSYTYDDANNKISQIDAKGIISTYSHDALNRLTAIGYPNSSLNVTYVYDENTNGQNGIGRLTTVIDASGTTYYRYDIRGNIIQQNWQNTALISYAYDDANRVQQITYPSGRVVDYSRDISGQITGVTTSFNGSTQTLVDNITYQAFGPVNAMTYGNGLLYSAIHDLDYQLDKQTLGNILQRDYTQNNVGNISTITDQIDFSKNQAFGYDELDRLINAQGHYGGLGYGYDANGNRLEKIIEGNIASYGYVMQSNQLLTIIDSAISQIYQYDANGNTLNNGHNQFSYGDDNRLHNVIQNGVVIASYTYNSKGERVIKVNSTQTRYHYDLNGQLLAETDNNGLTLKEYIYANGQLIAFHQGEGDQDQDGIADQIDNCSLYPNPAQIDSDQDGLGDGCDNDLDNNSIVDFGDVVTLLGFIGSADAKYDLDINGVVDFGDVVYILGYINQAPGPGPSNGIYYVHNDHLGTPQTITDQNQSVFWQANYNPFGKATITRQTITNNVRFPGQYFDQETGLHYNYRRYYDPSIGRYITSDPIGLQGGPNTYGYVNQNPLRFIDPFGLETTFIITYDSIGGVRFGSHSALYLGYGDAGQPAIYDPAGGYRRPSGGYDGSDGPPADASGLFTGPYADLGTFLNYHRDDGSSVEIFSFNTTRDEEEAIFEQALEIGDQRGFSCSASVSNAIDGIGLFKGLGHTGLPSDLARKLKNLIHGNR